jgi:hypothetical protein
MAMGDTVSPDCTDQIKQQTNQCKSTQFYGNFHLNCEESRGIRNIALVAVRET